MKRILTWAVKLFIAVACQWATNQHSFLRTQIQINILSILISLLPLTLCMVFVLWNTRMWGTNLHRILADIILVNILNVCTTIEILITQVINHQFTW